MSGCPYAGLFGSQGVTNADRNYRGSRFKELKEAVFENPYQKIWGAEGNKPLPIYDATFKQAFAGVLPGGCPDQLLAAAERTVDTRADLRWGEDRKGFRRIVHPNGICLFGKWEITHDNPYTGYFKKGSQGLVLARYSSNTATLRGTKKSLSLVGKIFPVTDENHSEPLIPASFFTQEDFGNKNTRYINDAVIQNSPDVTAIRRIPVGALILARLGNVFNKVDKMSDIRQLHEIAELGKGADEKTNTPEFMRLKVSEGQPRIEGEKLDFRDEIFAQIYDKGDPEPKRALSFDIMVANEGRTRRFTAAYKRVFVKKWVTIGKMTFSGAVASYNGDHVIHFHHPHWRDDRNDPSTAVRIDGRRVD